MDGWYEFVVTSFFIKCFLACLLKIGSFKFTNVFIPNISKHGVLLKGDFKELTPLTCEYIL